MQWPIKSWAPYIEINVTFCTDMAVSSIKITYHEIFKLSSTAVF